MSRTVFAPLDGSPHAEHALPWAAELARRSGAALDVVRVHLPPTVVAVEGFIPANPVAIDDAGRAAEGEYAASLTARLAAALPGVPAAVRVIELENGGDVPDTLLRAAAGAAFAVLATHARGPFARFFLGGTSDAFARHAPAPTLLVHPPSHEAPDLAARPQVRRVLVPLDGSPTAEEVLPAAAEVARLFGVGVTLFTAFDPVQTEPRDGWNATPSADRAKGYLDAMTAGLPDPWTTVEPAADAAAAILQAAADPGTLVALATHGRGGLSRMVFGSVADKVVRGHKGAVLVVRPTAARS